MVAANGHTTTANYRELSKIKHGVDAMHFRLDALGIINSSYTPALFAQHARQGNARKQRS
jgi:hypothetical protein